MIDIEQIKAELTSVGEAMLRLASNLTYGPNLKLTTEAKELIRLASSQSVAALLEEIKLAYVAGRIPDESLTRLHEYLELTQEK